VSERTEIKAVLFDFGGVVLTSPFEAFAAHEREMGLPEGFIRQLNATNPDTNAWAKLERAEVDIEGFCELFEGEAAAAGHAVSGLAVLECLSGQVRPEMVEALRRIKAAGLPLALLTNNFTTGDVAEHRPDVAEAMAIFDVVIESSKAGVRKPDPAAYQLVLDELGVAADEVVFLDDLGINLKPAREMGMRTIKVVDPGDALAELESVIGLPLR
jgi:putative hydrolase of the HAD superfamily